MLTPINSGSFASKDLQTAANDYNRAAENLRAAIAAEIASKVDNLRDYVKDNRAELGDGQYYVLSDNLANIAALLDNRVDYEI